MEQLLKNVVELLPKNGWKLVGISGATNSGKTTAARHLKNRFPTSKVIHQDDFFREEDDPMQVWIEIKNPPRKHQNWEHQNCIDWEELVEKIQEIVSEPAPDGQAFLFIDGHILYNNRDIEPLFTTKFFIDLDKDTMHKRRLQRNYIPADPPGYFDEWVWPQYLENRELLKNQNKIIFIEGVNSTGFINQTIVDNLE